jgi:competence protein ComGC
MVRRVSILLLRFAARTLLRTGLINLVVSILLLRFIPREYA